MDRATDVEVLGLLGACRSARDRLIVLQMARAGLRRGEAVGLRREDLHFVVDATGLGCPVQGAHLHVVRRDTSMGRGRSPGGPDGAGGLPGRAGQRRLCHRTPPLPAGQGQLNHRET